MRYQGFALPTVIIASVVMMTILLASVGSTVSVRTAVQAQHNESLAKAAADAGIAYAKACYKQEGNTVTWSNDNPLRPNTDCTGAVESEQSAYVLSTSNAQTAFSVGEPEVNDEGEIVSILSQGTAELLRTSTGAVWRTYYANSSEAIDVFMGHGTYEVMYDDAIGSGSPSSQQIEHGTEIVIAPEPSVHGSLFDGWSDGYGNILQPGDPYVITRPVVFTAMWIPITP